MPRALRKLRQQAEQQHNDEESDSPPARKNLFGFLSEETQEDSQEEAQADPQEEAREDSQEDQPETPQQKAPRKPQAKTKRKKKSQQQADSDDDFERILAQHAHPQQDAPQQQSTRSLLCVDARFLDADAELKRIFGARVVAGDLRKKKAQRNPRRSCLASPREDWPQMHASGLSMDAVGSDPQTFAFVHSRAFQQTQFQFMAAVDTHDPNAIALLLRTHPFHIDALIQLSEILKHDGDVAAAADLIERALFAFERAFHPQFSIASATCRLSYNRAENRAFFLCLYRHINYLSRRGCWRTALEASKLLVALDQNQDPLCALLYIDLYAIKSHEYKWYLDFHEQYASEKGLSFLPNASFSIALVHWELENEQQKQHDKSSQLLREAIAKFPSVVSGIYERIGVNDTSVTESPFFHPYSKHHRKQEYVLQILVDFYVELAHSIWKIPDIQSWLRSQVAIVSQDLNASPRPKYIDTGAKIRATKFGNGNTIPRNIQRIMFLSDLQSLSSRLPRETTQEGILMYDPILPETAELSIYDEFRAEQARRMNPFIDMSTLEAFVRSLLPWLNIGQQGAPNDPELVNRVVAELMRRHQQQQRQQQANPANNPNQNAENDLPGEFPDDTQPENPAQDAADIAEAPANDTRQDFAAVLVDTITEFFGAFGLGGAAEQTEDEDEDPPEQE